MGKLIKRQQLIPEAILCSTATRAKQTCELVTREWKSCPEPRYLSELYHCPAHEIATMLQRLPDTAERALLIGHNPELADFLQMAAGYDDKFPTAALAELTIDVSSWRDVTAETAMTLIQVWRPRELE